MPLQDNDNLIVGRGDAAYKIEYKDLKEDLIGDGGDVDLSEYAKLEDPDQEIEAKRFLAGNDIRADKSDPTTVGVEIHGGLGIVHLKPKDGQVTPLEVFGPGSIINNKSSSIFRVTPKGEVHVGDDAVVLKDDGSVTAGEFIGEGTLPRPYGDEGSYLWIKDGEPAWTGEGDGPVPGPDPVEIKKPTVLSPAPGSASAVTPPTTPRPVQLP